MSAEELRGRDAPLRVAVLHSRYGSGPASGENRVVEDEARLLREAGHDVVVYELQAPETAVDRGKAAISAVWSRHAVRLVRDQLSRRDLDVVHCHNLFPNLSPAVLRETARLRLPTVMTLHNFRLMCLPATLLRDESVCELCVGRGLWNGVRYRCYRESLFGSGVLAASLTLHRRLGSFQKPAAYLAVSEFVRDKHVAHGLLAEQIVVKPNFAWSAPRRQGPGSYFLFAGRLSPEKGVDILVQRWRREYGRLAIVGEGPDEARLRRLAGPAVEFWGLRTAAEMPAIYSGARALCMPSICYEGAPRAILEAFAAGVPVIAANIGALPELVTEDVNGYLVSPDHAEGWQNAVQALNSDDVSNRLGEGAYASWAHGYAPERALENLERAYRLARERVGPASWRADPALPAVPSNCRPHRG